MIFWKTSRLSAQYLVSFNNSLLRKLNLSSIRRRVLLSISLLSCELRRKYFRFFFELLCDLILNQFQMVDLIFIGFFEDLVLIFDLVEYLGQLR